MSGFDANMLSMLMPMLGGAKNGGGNTDILSALAPMLAKNGGGNNDMLSALAPMLAKNGGGNTDILSALAPVLAKNGGGSDILSALAPMLAKNAAAPEKPEERPQPEYAASAYRLHTGDYNRIYDDSTRAKKYEALSKLNLNGGDYTRVSDPQSGGENADTAAPGNNVQTIMSLMQMLSKNKQAEQSGSLKGISGFTNKKITYTLERLLRLNGLFV